MDDLVRKQLDEQAQKIEAMYQSVEKTRKYLLIIMWSSVIMILLPLLAGIIIVPLVLSSFADMYSGFL